MSLKHKKESGLPSLMEGEDVAKLCTRLNTKRRNVPEVVSGVDFEANADFMCSVYGKTKSRSSFTPKKEAEARGLLTQLFGLEDIYHIIYFDPDGTKLSDFLFGGAPLTLLSRTIRQSLDMRVRGMLMGRELPGEIGVVEQQGLRNEDFMYLNKGIASASLTNTSAPSCAIILKPEVLGIQGTVAFNFEDTDIVGKYVRFHEKCGGKLTPQHYRDLFRLLMLAPHDLDGVRLEVGLASRFVLDDEPRRRMEREAQSRGSGYWESALMRAHVDFYEEHVWDVERAFIERVLNRTVTFSNGVADRIWDDEDDELRYLPHLTQSASRNREILVPEGVGERFIGRIVVLDKLYPKVEREARERGLTICGRAWDDVIVPASQHQEEAGVIEARRIKAEIEKKFGRVL